MVKSYKSYQTVPYCSRGSLHGQREYTIIFRHERAGEFTVFEIDSRPMPQDEERLPVAMRAIAYIIALIVTLISILLATWLYIDFEFLRRVHWIKTNLVALVLIGMVNKLQKFLPFLKQYLLMFLAISIYCWLTFRLTPAKSQF